MLVKDELCECMEELLYLGKVKQYCPPYNVMAEGFEDTEEGQLCLCTQIAEDIGYYRELEWISVINLYDELYPISYCPICGKKIEYKKIPELTKKL